MKSRYLGRRLLAPFIAIALGAVPASAAGLDGVRGSTPLTANPPALPSPRILKDGDRQPRSSDGQPPVIPHAIAGYRLDLRVNDCLSCHARNRTERFPAPAISIAHFIGRDGRLSQTVAAGRYFCTECHVRQAAVSPPIDNTFRVLPTVPLRRHLCMECHLPQIQASAPLGAVNSGVASPSAVFPDRSAH